MPVPSFVLAVAFLYGELNRGERVLDLVREALRHLLPGSDSLQIFDARDGRILAHKLPTTPEDPSIALVEGIKAAGQRYGFTLSDVGYLMHGTTIATNIP